jgi:hypothetical protein
MAAVPALSQDSTMPQAVMQESRLDPMVILCPREPARGYDRSDSTTRAASVLWKKNNYLWLQDFLEDQVTVTPDLYDVLRSFTKVRQTSA